MRRCVRILLTGLALVAVIGLLLGLLWPPTGDPPAMGTPQPGERSRLLTAARSGTSLADRLSAGAAAIYGVPMKAGDYLELVAQQQGLDLVATLYGPAGSQLLRVDSPNGEQGPERVFAVAPTSGVYRLELRSQSPPGSSGSYRLQIEPIHPAGDHDRIRAAAHRRFAEAEDLRRAGAVEAAIERYEALVPTWEKLGEVLDLAITLERLGARYKALSRLEEALVSNERALRLFTALELPAEEAKILNRLGLVYFEWGEAAVALEFFRRALERARACGEAFSEASALNNQGLAHAAMGRPYRALGVYEEARQRWRELGLPGEEAVSLTSIGEVYSTLRKMDSARDYHEQALALIRKSGNRQREAVILNNLGLLHRRMGQLQRAEALYRQSLEIQREVGYAAGEARTLNNLGLLHEKQGAIDEAREWYRQALEISRRIGDRKTEATLMNNLGWLADATGHPQKALGYYHRALARFEELGDSLRRATTLYGMATAQRHQDRLDEAQAHIEEALNVVEAVRGDVANFGLRTSFFGSRHDLYEFYVDLLMERYRREEEPRFQILAFEASERARARSFLDALQVSGPELRRRADPALLREEEALREQINAIAGQRLAAANQGAATPELTGFARRERQLLERLESVRTRMRAGRADAVAEPLNLAMIQRRVLDRDTQLLHYELAEPRSYLWLITTDSVTSVELPGKSAIRELAGNAYRLLTRSDRRASREQARHVNRALADLLLGAIDAERLGRLLIVAEGPLQLIPFGALLVPAAGGEGKAEPLLVDHEVIQVPSASVIAGLRRELRTPRRSPGTLAVIADPVYDAGDPRLYGLTARRAEEAPSSHLRRLPGAGLEGRALLELVPESHSFAALGFAANRATVLSGALADYAFLHFALHGVVDIPQPELSAIVLSQFDASGRPVDGFLRAYEISGLDLGADLVVLSACQTALGKQIEGEGVVGLARAFLHAGARQVVVSLWQVRDRATAELMRRFYVHMFRHRRNPAAALRAAQLSMYRERRWQAPFYWAAFVVQGDWQ